MYGWLLGHVCRELKDDWKNGIIDEETFKKEAKTITDQIEQLSKPAPPPAEAPAASGSANAD